MLFRSKTYNMSVSDIKVADGLCYAYIHISAYTINEVPYYWNINDNYNGGNYSHIAVSEQAAELSVTTGYKTYTLSSIGELYEGEDSWKNSLAVIKTTYNESLNYQLTPTNVKLEASDDGKKIYYVIEGTYTQTGFTSNELLQAALSELNVLKLTPTTGDIKNFSLSFVINDETTFTAKADITSLGNGSWMSRLNDEDIKLGAKEDAAYNIGFKKEYTVISKDVTADENYNGCLTVIVNAVASTDIKKVNNDAGGAEAKGKWTYYIQNAAVQAGCTKEAAVYYEDGTVLVTFKNLTNTSNGKNEERIYYMPSQDAGTKVKLSFTVTMNVNGRLESANALSKAYDLTANTALDVEYEFTVGTSALRLCPIVAEADKAEVTVIFSNIKISVVN